MQRIEYVVVISGNGQSRHFVQSKSSPKMFDEPSLIDIPIWTHALDGDREKISHAVLACQSEGVQQIEIGTYEFGRYVMRFELLRPDAAILILTHRVEQEADLTKREVQVVQLIAGDKTPSQIAKSLRIQQSTLASHLKRIRRKLGCQTNAGIAVYAMTHGLVRA